MPPLPPAPNIIRCVYQGTYASAKWANVFHLKYTGGPPSTIDMNSLATGLRTQWATNFAPIVNTAVTLTSVTCVDLSTVTGNVGLNSTTAAGTNATTVGMPANVALVISFKVARRYRGGHPRMYLTGQATTNTALGISWTGTWVTTCNSAAAAWLTGVNALTYTTITTVELHSLSYWSNHILRPTPTSDRITAASVHTRIDTQRRRLGRETA